MKIVNDFLDQKEFDKLQNIMMGETLPWFFNAGITDSIEKENTFQFVHAFYVYQRSFIFVDHNYISILDCLLDKINPTMLCRIKANLLIQTPNIIENIFHIDIGVLEDFPEKLKQLTTSIFYVNTNNGYTKFEDDTKIESIANRMVTFPANMKHTGTSCTDQNTRVVINFNYFAI